MSPSSAFNTNFADHRHLGQVAALLTPELESLILEATRVAPEDVATYWDTRKLAAHLDVSHMMVARVLRL